MSYSAASLRWAREEADRPHATREHRQALREIARTVEQRRERQVTGWEPDHVLRMLADERAALIREDVARITEPMGTHQAADWLARRVAELQGRALTWRGQAAGLPPARDELAGMYARAQCAIWWRRCMRRECVRLRELAGMQRGEVCRRAGQVYVTTDTVERRRERVAANRAMLEATELEAADGEVITLAQAADSSTANPAIRRGELMTRIRGCEEWAQAAGYVGLFTTHTCPSRYHAQTMHGGANPRHDGSTPRDAQGWLRRTWQRTRARLHRLRVPVFGFRVAEPHHDGCPHWHMLLWTTPAEVERLAEVMRAQWLAEDGDEPGAQQHRFRSVAMVGGQAAGYVAKYVAKNVDDAGAVGTQGHHDEDHTGQADWIGGTAARVAAWASAHGIRQFQSIGQPPVTVWRELRRVELQAVQGAAPAVVEAHAAVSRDAGRRACWRRYMDAQGGPTVGRGYAVRIMRADEAPAEPNAYGEERERATLGVYHVSRPDELIQSSRREWRPRGHWTAADRAPVPAELRVCGFMGQTATAGCPPRTRVNNCTGRPRGGLMSAGLVGLLTANLRGSGAITTQEGHTWPTPTPPTTSPRPTAARWITSHATSRAP
ncbi:MAG: hypothetical protein RIQ53_3087 [Pseudomonadota bacterium]|jgi:hypothetical protein